MDEKVFSVTELNTIVKRIIDSEELLFSILVSGEVTNFKISGAHGYFTLKDEGSQLFCTYFGAGRSESAFIPKNGDKVLVRGSLDYYVKGGSMSFKVSKITPAGLGALYMKFLELKEKLEKEGLFDEKYKKPIPKDVKRIGVITSPTGAVIKDIINVTTRRNPYIDVVLFPVKVQGENAEKEIATAIDKMDKLGFDVLIVGRGGGSFEDLAPFNTEEVARAVFKVKTPIISAVGHETDFSLCDFASDLRAPTPSAAAEIAAVDLQAEISRFIMLSTKMRDAVVGRLKYDSQKIKGNVERLSLITSQKLTKGESKIVSDANYFVSRIKEIYTEKLNNVKLLSGELNAKSPLALIEKGYAKVLKEGKPISTIDSLAVGDEIVTTLLNGDAVSKVTDIKRRNSK